MKNAERNISYEELISEMEQLRFQLTEANETIEAIRNGQIDALIVKGENGHQLYTLKTADQTYRVFIEKMTEGAVTLNHEGIILYCNSQFASMVQKPLSTVIGQPFILFIENEGREAFLNLFKNAWAKDLKGEYLLLTESGHLSVQLSLTTLAMDEGVSLSIIVTDLTMQKETQKQLRQHTLQLEKMNRALEMSNHDLLQFASVASHDLQEPLRKILIFSNLLHEKNKDNLSAESADFLTKIMHSSHRMKALIIDILNYSKLSESAIAFEAVDLTQVIKELMEDFEIMIQDKHATIRFDTLPVLQANRGQIRQVFLNIISNALKFSVQGKEPLVIISWEKVSDKSFDSPPSDEGRFARISIKDNGIGFDQQYVENIFTLFERLHAKDKYEGTGIGLAITKKIIEKHKGIITAFSREGEGAEFLMVLPLAQQMHD